MKFEFLKTFASIHKKYNSEYPHPIKLLSQTLTSHLAGIDIQSAIAAYGGQLLEEFDYHIGDATAIVDVLNKDVDKNYIQDLVCNLNTYKSAFSNLLKVI